MLLVDLEHVSANPLIVTVIVDGRRSGGAGNVEIHICMERSKRIIASRSGCDIFSKDHNDALPSASQYCSSSRAVFPAV